MTIEYHQKFRKQYQKLSPKLRQQVQERISVFVKNQKDPVLQNHSLYGKYQDFFSINITGDLRALYKKINQNYIKFILLGTHSQLYK